MEPQREPKARHVRNDEKVALKTNRPLWGFVFIALSAAFAYYLYDMYYGHQHFPSQLEAGILKR